MIINDQNIDIDDLFSQKYMHKKLDNGLFLSEYQIDVLMRNNINPYECASINELMYIIDECLDDDNDELENIYKEISEFNYYHNTNK